MSRRRSFVSVQHVVVGRVVALADSTIYLAEAAHALEDAVDGAEEEEEEEEERERDGGPSLRFTGRRVFKRVHALQSRLKD